MKSNLFFSLENSLTTTWSGGTSSHLYVFPEDAQFSERNFDFRISSATIEVDESTFTSLPTYNRILAVLEGSLELMHVGKPSTRLEEYEQVFFHGSWETSSIGKVRDFNVIFNANYDVEMQFIAVTETKGISKSTDFLFVFCLSDQSVVDLQSVTKYTLIEVRNEVIALQQGNYFVIRIDSVRQLQTK